MSMQAADLPREMRHDAIAGALRDLTRLTLRATTGAETPESIASRALETLIVLCDAQRGAIALMPNLPDEATGATPMLSGARPRVLAARGMAEEDAWLLYARRHSILAGEGSAAGEIIWVTGQLPLSSAQSGNDEPGANPGRAPVGPALVLLGWGDHPQAHALAARAHEALATIGDAAAAALAAALLAERARAAEASAVRGTEELRAMAAASADWEETFNAVSDPICVVTPDYKLVHANAAYRALVGMTDDQAMGVKCYSVGHARGGPCAGCPLPATVSSQRPTYVQQERFLPRGPEHAPEHRIYQRWTYPILDAGGEVVRAVEIIKDITEQDQLRQVMAQERALRVAERLKAELLGTVSHELRSPLTIIKGYAATLLRHERHLPREERHEFLRAISAASDRLEVIIDRLLEMSQLETGDLILDRQLVNVPAIAREAIIAAEQRALEGRSRPVTFALHRQPVLWGAPDEEFPPVEADPRRLREVLDNLLENAVKYSLGGGSVEVELRIVPPGASSADPAGGELGAGDIRLPAVGSHPRAMVEIVVRDFGVGIPAEHLGRIFDRFHRVDSSLTREVEGLGLGLAICKRLVELHGGMIWADSTPGSGSAFHVMLPIHHVATVGEPIETAALSEG
jgi:signal transduction histidine kinase